MQSDKEDNSGENQRTLSWMGLRPPRGWSSPLGPCQPRARGPRPGGALADKAPSSVRGSVLDGAVALSRVRPVPRAFRSIH